MTFPLLDETIAPEGARNALAVTKKNFGMIPNLEKVMASASPLLEATLPYGISSRLLRSHQSNDRLSISRPTLRMSATTVFRGMACLPSGPA